jgi:guanylate cyclase
VFYVGIPILTLRLLHELEGFLEMLRATDEAVKAEATQPLYKMLESRASVTAAAPKARKSDNRFLAQYSIGIVFVHCEVAVMMVLFLWRTREVGDTYRIYQQWQCQSGLRDAKTYQVIVYVYNLVFLTKTPVSYTTANESRSVARVALEQLERYTQNMRIEDGVYRPIAGSDPILDVYTMGTGCKEALDPTTLHDLYDCAGASQLVRTFTSIASNVCGDPESCNGTLECNDAMTLIHLVPQHLDSSLSGIDQRITEMKQEAKDSFGSAMTAVYVSSVLIILVAFVIEFQFLSKLATAYSVCLCLLKKLPPSSILGNADLLDYVLGKKKLDERIKTSVAETIVLGSADGIILASHLGIIDVVNQVCCNILTCSQEDLLGQHMTVIFGGDDVAHIQAQIRLLQDHQRNSDMWEGEVDCKTQDESKTILCQVTILAMYGSDESISDLIMIIRDISELHSQ